MNSRLARAKKFTNHHWSNDKSGLHSSQTTKMQHQGTTWPTELVTFSASLLEICEVSHGTKSLALIMSKFLGASDTNDFEFAAV